jgi:hypothetical protein
VEQGLGTGSNSGEGGRCTDAGERAERPAAAAAESDLLTCFLPSFVQFGSIGDKPSDRLPSPTWDEAPRFEHAKTPALVRELGGARNGANGGGGGASGGSGASGGDSFTTSTLTSIAAKGTPNGPAPASPWP